MCNCLTPTTCWRCGTIIARDGVRSQRLVWSFNEALNYFHGNVFALKESEVSVPCGKCYACLMRKRRDMSVRLSHEASCHEASCFVTLTYNDDNIPVGNDGHYTLVPADVQKFVKRLRRHLEYVPKRGDRRDHVNHPIRYFAVGEYGGKTHRPHYHLLIFGWSPSDKSFLFRRGKIDTFRSAQIEKLWKFGFATVQDVGAGCARYCSRYCTKKFTRSYDLADDQCPEFTLQSVRNGGIGALWCDKYGAHVCKIRSCTLRSGERIIAMPVPKYYYNRLRKTNQRLWIECRDERLHFVLTHKAGDADARYDDLVRKCECDKLICRDKLTKEVL